MNRTDRLYAIAEELRASGTRARTATELAEKFEVTTRTVKRDVSALQQAGVPIYSVSGRGGGYRVLPHDALLRPVTFTAAEAVAIATALRTQADLPYATDGAAALTKVMQAMTPGAVAAAESLARRVWSTAAPRRSRTARTLDVAVAERRVVRIAYLDRNGGTSTRTVDPLQFAHAAGRWYLLAYCRDRKGGRWFRLDRITRAHLTSERAQEHDVEAVVGSPPPEARPIAVR
ncbi:MAG TPA: WYL domain-containing protein [Acidimicrobiales bacterium]